ncbi:MAG: hypothetical protein HOH04_07385 [Rhodospirillaceae bacterium]|jgi:bile acid:Na+ symporter, BASS family|nr:hypothetical protein [Rhodospirillaceae bacterium]
MIRALTFLGRHASTVMVSAVFIGLAVQPLAAASKPLLLPGVWALLTMSMMRLEGRAFFAVFQKPLRMGSALVWMLGITPVLMWGIVTLFPLSDPITAALVLTAGSSSLMSTPAIGLILGLDAAFILALLVAATLILPFTLPIVAVALLGLPLEISVFDLTLRLAALVGSAGLAAMGLRWVIGAKRLERATPALDGVAVVLLLLFAIPLMDGITARLFAEPGYMLFLTGLSFAVYIGQMLLSALVFSVLWRDRHAALSAGLAVGCRNLAILIAVLAGAADREIITYFALAQFPIYIMPSVMKVIFARSLRAST